MTENDVVKVFRDVLVREKPSKRRYRKVLSLAEKMVKKVEDTLKSFKLEGEVEVEGSVAKDTWLKDEVDIDIFILAPEQVEEEKLRT
ncbi:MAG: nucleotidyltransferase domain-containing protein, partial [Candidatus Bathyarchaeota archaeon]|nr:nucleotidyltransferase domain-containing protein [Candidatus Bathyarchaeota archaeon]